MNASLLRPMNGGLRWGMIWVKELGLEFREKEEA